MLTVNYQNPLPTVLTDFFAFKLCDFIKTKKSSNNRHHVPELLYFILKITSQANISCHIAIVALIYIERCKKALPKNAIGDQDTIHRLFLASILVASKFLHDANTRPLLNNARMAEICSRFYTLEEINQLEMSFLSLIKFECFVYPNQIQDYVLQHRQDLLI